jgi:exopolyphosphatase / guanosine-5'-triphosphate,3'-diphosphate pyrophosphatase
MPKAQSGGQVVAVVDCGASAVRAYIAEVSKSGWRVLDDVTHPQDLAGALVVGRMNRSEMDGIVDGIEQVQELATGYGVASFRVVGTSVLREATNRDVLQERIAQRTGLEMEVIDAAEEARLYFLALRALVKREKLPLRGKTLLVDVGSSSSIMSVISGEKLIHSVDEHFGTVRASETFRYLHDSFHYAPTIDRSAAGVARMTLRRLPLGRCQRLLITGSELRHFAVAQDPDAEGPLVPVKLAAIEAWCRENATITLGSEQARQMADLVEPMRLVPAISMARHLCRELGQDELWIPHLNLRDGLVADLCPGGLGPHHLNRTNLQAEARNLCDRFRMDKAYAANTASLATQIFDQTTDLHHLGERERLLLEFAAWVHDIGAFVNVRNRHKHSMYLIGGSDISGLTGQEKAIVANVARYHRRSPPTIRHAEFMALPRPQRVAVQHLSAILRLAYGLDVDREQRIKQVRCQVHEGRLLLHVDRRQVELERWSIRDKSDLFREVVGLDAEVVARTDI